MALVKQKKNIQKLNLNLNQQSTVRDAHVCISFTVHNYSTQYNNTDNFPSYPPDSYCCSNVVYWRGGAAYGSAQCFTYDDHIQGATHNTEVTRMWANAQPDGRPAEHGWRPLFSAAKFS